MKHQILFIQGGGQSAHDEWDIKLVDSLQRALGSDYEIRYPRMPDEDDPSYASWSPAIEREIEALRDDAVLVGHSVGGTILLKTIAEQSPRTFGGIFLLATPFVGDGGWPSDEIEFPTNLGARLSEVTPIHLWHGLNDDSVPPSHVELYARTIPQACVHRVAGRDHQFNNDLKDVATIILSLETRRGGKRQAKTEASELPEGVRRAPHPR